MIIIKIQGGLGNQLFLYAIGKSMALRTGQDLKYDLTFFENEKFKNIYRLDKLQLDIKIATKNEIKELTNVYIYPIIRRIIKFLHIKCLYNKSSHFIEGYNKNIPKKLINWDRRKSIYLDGYFQYPEVFNEFRKDIIKIFIPNLCLSENYIEVLNLIKNTQYSVAIHIRKGDLLKNPSFYKLNDEYFLNAIKIIKNRILSPHFFVFSDDPEDISQSIKNMKDLTIISNNSYYKPEYSRINDVDELFLISQCSHFILSNSTFGWWGAYLATCPNKITVIPSKWYLNENLQNRFESSKMILNEWIKL